MMWRERDEDEKEGGKGGGAVMPIRLTSRSWHHARTTPLVQPRLKNLVAHPPSWSAAAHSNMVAR